MEAAQFKDYGLAGDLDEASRLEMSQTRWKEAVPDEAKLDRDLRAGKIGDIEDEGRIEKFVERELERAGQQRQRGAVDPLAFAREAMIGSSDLVSVEFLEAGWAATRPVGRVNSIIETGTGFHVGNDIILTNHHVIRDAEQARLMTFELDVESHRFGDIKPPQAFQLDPERFFATDEAHDFTFVAAGPDSDRGISLRSYGSIPLDADEGKILIGMAVNVVGHPKGRPKEVVLRNNVLLALPSKAGEPDIDRYCFYSADTERGSSGSPVFNDWWELVALHHSGVPKTNEKDEPIGHDGQPVSLADARANPELVQWVANEGIRVSRLVRRFSELDLAGEMAQIRATLLASWSQPVAARAAAPTVHESNRVAAVVDASSGTGDRVTIPLSITVSVDPGQQ